MSLLLGIIRIIFLNIKKLNKSSCYGHPLFRVFVGLFLVAIFGIFVFFQSRIDLENEQEKLAFHNRFKRGNISYVSISFEESDYCEIKHTENLDYLAELINNMEIKSCKNYDVNSKRARDVLFSISFTGYERYYNYVFYQDSPWIYYYFSEGDIFPNTGSYSFEADSVSIEAIYSYLVENHESFHKVEEENLNEK